MYALVYDWYWSDYAHWIPDEPVNYGGNPGGGGDGSSTYSEPPAPKSEYRPMSTPEPMVIEEIQMEDYGRLWNQFTLRPYMPVDYYLACTRGVNLVYDNKRPLNIKKKSGTEENLIIWCDEYHIKVVSSNEPWLWYVK